MKRLFLFLTLLVTLTSMSQITTTTLENKTERVLFMQEYPKDSAVWVITKTEIRWEYYDEAKNLLLNDKYSILQTTTDVNTNSTYYIVKDDINGVFKVQLWNLDDGTKCVTHGFASNYVNYFGNVNYIVNI